MSDPPTTSSEPPQHHHHQLLHLPLIHSRTASINAASSSPAMPREYRKGNWTLQETMILITAKKLDDDRRTKSSFSPPDRKSGELRWKWVENYCFTHGCHRSQNQCNDKWDNLLRDYKKLREYESKAPASDGFVSYWKMEKHDRKDRNLPSNMAFEVYQALNDVVQRKYSTRSAPANVVSPSAALPPLLPAPEAATATFPAVEESTSGTQSSEKGNMETKRKKMSSGDEVLGSSIERSASVLAETLRSCEEQREIRHQQLMEIHRQRLQIEETRNQLHRQGIADLVATLSGVNQRREGYGHGHGHGSLYSGEEISVLKQQNEAMQAELITIKTELSQLRQQMPNLLQTMMHTMIHNLQPSTSHPQPPHPMDPSGSGGDA